MNTPICEFIEKYKKEKNIRLHMPGHKGRGKTESGDITEIDGADVLYNGDGIISESEKNASLMYKTKKTVYSAEGSSLSIRAMVYLLKLYAKEQGKKPLILAGRNAHKSFVTAAAILDVDVKWLYSEDESILSCSFNIDSLSDMLNKEKPLALYLTSPDYLGNMIDVKRVGEICKKNGVLFFLDNAHGAYLNFLTNPCHPMELGADLCADSAHKTLNVLTGGAYLHISKKAPEFFSLHAEEAMALFASTSPSYVILSSLDKINSYLEKGIRKDIKKVEKRLSGLKEKLKNMGFSLVGNEPLKLSLYTKPYGYEGNEMAKELKKRGIVVEFSDPDYITMMFSSSTRLREIDKVGNTISQIPKKDEITKKAPLLEKPKVKMKMHEAIMMPGEKVCVSEGLGRILASPSVNCPPAIAPVVCGEEINESAIKIFEYYNIKECFVVKENK